MYCAVLFSALKIMKKIDGPVKYGMVLEGITLVNIYQNIYVVKTKYCYKLWNDRVLQGLKILYVLIVYDLQKQNKSQIILKGKPNQANVWVNISFNGYLYL